MTALDSSFEAAFLFTHSMAGTKGGVLSHTLLGKEILEVRLNGRPVGEMGLNAALAGYHGVPVVLVVGDEAVCQEAKTFLGEEVVVVATKTAIERFAGICLPPMKSQTLIREAAEEALRRRKKIRPLMIEPPIELEFNFSSVSMATVCSLLPHVELVDSRSVLIKENDLVAAYNLGFVCTLLAVSPFVRDEMY